MTPTPPSARQLRYLRDLALQRGESFAYPQTTAEASSEIERLRSRTADSKLERRLDRRAIDEALAESGDAAAIREEEIVGYGSSARLAQPSEPDETEATGGSAWQS